MANRTKCICSGCSRKILEFMMINLWTAGTVIYKCPFCHYEAPADKWKKEEENND